jgi:hypothetical protein
MDPVTMGMVSMGVGGALKVFGGLFNDTASRQAGLMRQEAQLKLSSLEENMRRTEGQQTQVLSSTKARMAGTGFAGDSPTFSNYITSMATQFETQNTFATRQGRQSVDLMNSAADLQEGSGMLGKLFGAASDALGTAGSIAGMFKVGQAPAAPGLGVP